jgi:hypothetical protein
VEGRPLCRPTNQSDASEKRPYLIRGRDAFDELSAGFAHPSRVSEAGASEINLSKFVIASSMVQSLQP